MGHLSKEELIRVFNVGGAAREVLRHIEESFKCQECEATRKPFQRRRAAVPRTFTFNRFLPSSHSMHYVPRDTLHCALHFLCFNASQRGGAGEFQQTRGASGQPKLLEPWATFIPSCVKYFCFPVAMLTDNGLELAHNYAIGAELNGMMWHITNRTSPWENGLTERHAALAKEIIEKEIMAQHISTLEALATMISQVHSGNISRPIRVGFSPSQLLQGSTRNIPGELMADPSLCEAANQEILTAPADRYLMGTQYVRNHEARSRMQKEFTRKDTQDLILRAGRLRARPKRGYFRRQ